MDGGVAVDDRGQLSFVNDFNFDDEGRKEHMMTLGVLDKNYYFKNPIIEIDFKEWCKQVIWFGRRSNQFKCHPEHLEERKQVLE